MSLWPDDIAEAAAALVRDLTRNGIMVVTAESCTGGLIAAALTEIPGSSRVVDRGFVTYSNEAKVAMLGVKAGTLQEYGAVSSQTAEEMARGALAHSQARLAVAVTGIAGPGGGTAEKPVGLVYLAALRDDGRLIARDMHYGDIGREAIRLATVRTALSLLAELALHSSMAADDQA